MNRLLTDMQIVGLVIAVCWLVFYFGPIVLGALLDPYADDFDDVDELARRDRFPDRPDVHSRSGGERPD
jgi:hypothetical protein